MFVPRIIQLDHDSHSSSAESESDLERVVLHGIHIQQEGKQNCNLRMIWDVMYCNAM